jgi:hypothetical protein
LILKIVAVSILALTLAGCNTTNSMVVQTRTVENLDFVQPANPRPINTRPINLKVYDRDALEVAMLDPEFRRLIGMTEKDYANIAYNYQEAIRFIEAQSSTIQYYEEILNDLRNRNIVAEE